MIFSRAEPVAAVVKLTCVMAEAPISKVPRLGDTNDPPVDPSIAEVNVTLSAGSVPMFCTVTVAVTVPDSRCSADEVITSLIPPHGDEPAVKLKVTVPKLVAPSCNWSVAVIV